MTDPDPLVLRIDALSLALRVWLRECGEIPPVQASALAYEAAALIARHADTLTDAYDLVDAWADNMKNQIGRLGVGVEHP